MRRLRPSDRVWIAFGVTALVYNVFIAEEGDTLSEAWDRYLARWPWMESIIHTLAKHLANEWAPQLDPVGIAFVAARAVFRRKPAVVVVVD